MPRGCPRPKGPENTVFCDFPPLGVRSVKTQSAKRLRCLREKLLGVRFFLPKVPLAQGNRVFLFSARNFSKCQGAALGQKGLKTQYFAISRPWGSGRSKRKMQKSCALFGRNLCQVCPVFCRKSAPSSGKSRFSDFGPEFLQVPRGCPRPKGPKNTVFCDFPHLGVRSVKTQNVKKLRGFREKLLGVRFFPQKCP